MSRLGWIGGLALIVAAARRVLASTAGDAFARLRFRGRDALFATVIATLMVPSQATSAVVD